MKHLLIITACFITISNTAEPCGSNFGVGNHVFQVSSDICKTEAIELYNQISNMDFDIHKKAKLNPKDVQDIVFIHSQNRGFYDRCRDRGYLVTTNMKIVRQDNEVIESSSTAICFKKRRKKRLIATKVYHDSPATVFPQLNFDKLDRLLR